MKMYEKTNEGKTGTILAGGCLTHTKQHKWLINEVIDDFLDSVALIPNNKWKKYARLSPVQRFKQTEQRTQHFSISWWNEDYFKVSAG